jgi:hypothetical protein
MAKVKLEEAQFFLEKLEKSTDGGLEFRHFLTAFLQSCMSIPEWLLYEYAQKYLGLSQDDYVDQGASTWLPRLRRRKVTVKGQSFSFGGERGLGNYERAKKAIFF